MTTGLFVSLLQVKYRESWHTLRGQGYKLTMQDIPFQAAKSSTGIASDVRTRQETYPPKVHHHTRIHQIPLMQLNAAAEHSTDIYFKFQKK